MKPSFIYELTKYFHIYYPVLTLKSKISRVICIDSVILCFEPNIDKTDPICFPTHSFISQESRLGNFVASVITLFLLPVSFRMYYCLMQLFNLHLLCFHIPSIFLIFIIALFIYLLISAFSRAAPVAYRGSQAYTTVTATPDP